ncbi:unnamed protein product [Leptosia nina]|uniref:Uncharacterized protein n=1 Tax=Leptosia nina TaxID=320188 RepID=A0AAV1JSJ0_9NEOP
MQGYLIETLSPTTRAAPDSYIDKRRAIGIDVHRGLNSSLSILCWRKGFNATLSMKIRRAQQTISHFKIIPIFHVTSLIVGECIESHLGTDVYILSIDGVLSG